MEKMNLKLAKKKYYIKNRDRILKNRKEYYQKNKDKYMEYIRKYYQENKDKLDMKNREYRNKNKEKIAQWNKQYYKDNKEKIKESNHLYWEKNKNKLKKINHSYQKQNHKKLREHKKIYINKNINYHIGLRLRNLLWYALNKYTKNGKVMVSTKYGVDYHSIIEYLKPFPTDLSKWHIDHIKPLCSFDLTNPEEVKKAFAPENHRWLRYNENCSKASEDKKQKVLIVNMGVGE